MDSSVWGERADSSVSRAGRDKRPHPEWGYLLPKTYHSPPMCFSVWKVLLMSVSPVLVKDSWTISSPSPWISLSVAIAILNSPHYWVVWWYQLQMLSQPTSCHRIVACESWKGLRDVILRRENWSSKKEQWLVWSNTVSLDQNLSGFFYPFLSFFPSFFLLKK